MLPFHLTVLPGCCYPYPMIDYVHVRQRLLKQRFCVRVFDKQLCCPFSILCRCPSEPLLSETLLSASSRNPLSCMHYVHHTFAKCESCAFVNSCVLIVFLTIGCTIIRHKLYVNLNLLSRVICSYIRLGFARMSYIRSFIQLQSSYCPKHCLIAPFISFFAQPVPQHNHIIVVRIMPPYERIFFLCLLRRVVFWAM